MTTQHHNRKYVGAVLAALAVSGAIESSKAMNLAPASVFVQERMGDQKTQATVMGVTWMLPLNCEFRFRRLGAYAEVAIGRWHTDGRNGATSRPTQISAIPNLRFYPSNASTRFTEIGVGPSYIGPLFRTGHKRISTEFNFDDRIANGPDFGHSEVSLRADHFSNAGIGHPNPGEDFAQLRYAYRI
ncbi:MAG: acyloxyacyl hydrolase [Steroidobacteraceae bacterium]